MTKSLDRRPENHLVRSSQSCELMSKSENAIIEYENGPSVIMSEIPQCRDQMHRMAMRRVHICGVGKSSHTGSSASMISVARVVTGENHHGSCMRTHPAQMVAMRFWHNTQWTADRSCQVAPGLFA